MEKNEIQSSTDEILEINKAKRDLKIELVLFFVLGFLLGITIKTEAAKKITIGFDDYRVRTAQDSYNVSEIKKKMIEDAQKQAQADLQKTAEQQQ